MSHEQTPAVICALREHSECRFKIIGLGDFSPAGQLKRVLRIDDHRLEWILPPEDPEGPSLWEKLEAIANSIPDEDLAKIPTDFSANYKHYMYGWPKRENIGTDQTGFLLSQEWRVQKRPTG